ncbi:MAG: TolC family protein [Planctomycetota bacterium]
MVLSSALRLVLVAAPCAASALAHPDGEAPQDDSVVGPVQEPVEDDMAQGELRPLSLEDSLALALTNNLGLERARIESEAARFDALSTWGAFDWVFDATGTYSDSEQEGGDQLFGGEVVTTQRGRVDLDLTRPLTTGGRFVFHFDSQYTQTDNVFANDPELYQSGISLTYVQPLLRGAWQEYNTAQQREAEITQQRRFEERRDARQQLIQDVEVAYWELVSAMEQLRVSRAALELGREQVQRENARLRAGDGTEVDVLQAQTEVATRTQALLQAENDVAQRSDDLKRLLVRDEVAALWTQRIEPTTPLPEANPDDLVLPNWADAYQVALGRRADLRTARLDVDVSRIRLTRAQSERLYGLDLELTAAAGAFDVEFPDAVEDSANFRFPRYAATLVYNMPLQNRTASNAEYAARQRLRGTQVALEEAEVMALADVRQAIRDLRFRAEAVRAAEQSFALARRQLEAEQQRFEADLTTTFEVLQFQQTAIESAVSRTVARMEYAKSLVALRRAQGVLGEVPDPNRN